MAKLILKYEAAVLKEIPLQKATLTVGRTPGNDVVIDNLGPSAGRRCPTRLEQIDYLVEDMSSLNGTFLNNQRIRTSALKDGDEILIGKHTLIFRDEGGALPCGRPCDGGKHSADQAAGRGDRGAGHQEAARTSLPKRPVLPAKVSSPTDKDKIGCLTVLQGKTDQHEYILTSKL